MTRLQVATMLILAITSLLLGLALLKADARLDKLESAQQARSADEQHGGEAEPQRDEMEGS